MFYSMHVAFSQERAPERFNIANRALMFSEESKGQLDKPGKRIWDITTTGILIHDELIHSFSACILLVLGVLDLIFERFIVLFRYSFILYTSDLNKNQPEKCQQQLSINAYKLSCYTGFFGLLTTTSFALDHL